jgi:geranylgeranylglycerol-phosphate geranylgeranyltransferase
MNLYAYIQLARPLNGLIAFLSVIFGAFLAGGNINPIFDVIIASAIALMLLSAGNAINDYFDVESDKINKPRRPIPSGKISKHSALTFSVLLFIIGTSLSLIVNWVAFLIALFVSLTLIFYAGKLRKLPLLSNLVVGLLTSLTFIYGGVAVGKISGAIMPAIFAFLFTSMREIVKDIQDIDGDRATGMSSLAIKYGNKKAVYIALIFFSLLIIASPIPYLLDYYSIYYLLCVFFGVDIVLIFCMISLIRQPSKSVAGRIANIMKFDIFIGLIAIYLGNLKL